MAELGLVGDRAVELGTAVGSAQREIRERACKVCADLTLDDDLARKPGHGFIVAGGRTAFVPQSDVHPGEAATGELCQIMPSCLARLTAWWRDLAPILW